MFRRVHSFVFRYRLTKDALADPKVSGPFEKRVPLEMIQYRHLD